MIRFALKIVAQRDLPQLPANVMGVSMQFALGLVNRDPRGTSRRRLLLSGRFYGPTVKNAVTFSRVMILLSKKYYSNFYRCHNSNPRFSFLDTLSQSKRTFWIGNFQNSLNSLGKVSLSA